MVAFPTPYEGVPITAGRGRWAVDLCRCCGSKCCLLPLCVTCVPCFPLARAAARAGVCRYTTVLVVAGVLVLLVSMWPDLEERNVYVDEVSGANATNSTGGSIGWEEVYAEPVNRTLYVASSIGYWSVAAGFLVLCLIVRRRLVAKYEIDEHPLVSCLLTTCLGPCAIGQQLMHVGARAARARRRARRNEEAARRAASRPSRRP